MDRKPYVSNKLILGGITVIAVIGVTITMVSWTNNKMLPSEYVSWCQKAENGHKYIGENDLYAIEFQHCTPTYMALQEIKSDDIPQEQFEMVEAKFKDIDYYRIKVFPKSDKALLSTKSLETGNSDKQQLHNYINAFLQDDIHLEIGDQQLDCMVYHFENGSGILPFHSMIIGFDIKGLNAGQDKILVINDQYLDMGKLQAGFGAQAMNKEPQIILH